MLPRYANGDLVFASKSKRVGQVRVLRHPYNPGGWLVKRVASVRGDDMTINGDNPDTLSGFRSSAMFRSLEASG